MHKSNMCLQSMWLLRQDSQPMLKHSTGFCVIVSVWLTGWRSAAFLTWSFCSLAVRVWSTNLSILSACSCIFSHTSTSWFWWKHTHTNTHTLWFLNEHITAPEHHQLERQQENPVFSNATQRNQREIPVQNVSHPRKSYEVHVLLYQVHEHNFHTLAATILNKLAGRNWGEKHIFSPTK